MENGNIYYTNFSYEPNSEFAEKIDEKLYVEIKGNDNL
jgi:hypothetical protein